MLEQQYLMGWLCPRCQRILAPWMSKCDCLPPTKTANSFQVELAGSNEVRTIINADAAAASRPVGVHN